ncbi:Agmatine deiminase [Alphaproteobacteria bacterium SO-S41]|nr:Agmatine deiminase [Alphaproteobacteria bacterium SO-S41]
MRRLDAEDDVPVRDQFYMPAEWAPHARTWMQWPCRVAPWGTPEAMALARQAYGQVARTIAKFEPVTMVVRPQDKQEAQLILGSKIQLFEAPIDDSWARDSGPTFLVDGKGGRAGIQWRFNAWGTKYTPFENDASVATKILKSMDLKTYEGPLTVEGGALHVDGAGTLLVTEQCLLNENRNPELTRQQIEARLALYLGVIRIIWLGDGLKEDETDGHIDNVACFAPGGRVMLAMPHDKSDPNYGAMSDNLVRLHDATNADGKKPDVVELPLPYEIKTRHDGSRLEMSYVNYYLANGAVIMPAFDDKADEVAKRILADVFPDREIVQLDAMAIIEGGGGIHCITQQQPA